MQHIPHPPTDIVQVTVCLPLQLPGGPSRIGRGPVHRHVAMISKYVAVINDRLGPCKSTHSWSFAHTKEQDAIHFLFHHWHYVVKSVYHM